MSYSKLPNVNPGEVIESAHINQLNNNIESLCPIGTYKAIDPDYSALIDDCWHLCDGSIIDDVDSPRNTFRTRNLNGADVVLNLTWSTESGNSSATLSDQDVSAINIGDWVSGAGIQDGAIVKDIVDGVVIVEGDFTGMIETTFNNDGISVEGGVDNITEADKMQRITGNAGGTYGHGGHYGGLGNAGALSQTQGYLGVMGGGAFAHVYSGNIYIDSANSPDARTSDTTIGRTSSHRFRTTYVVRIK